ncbi:MAG: DDE-type integrase/transposase/recombinase [Acidimicrobiales bacterium]
MTVTPINVAAAAYLAGLGDDADAMVVDSPHPELARLLKLKAARGTISSADYAEAARALGVGKRQIQRMVSRLTSGETPAARRRFALNDHHEQVIMACQGNVALAYRQLIESGERLPRYITFWRAWYCQPTGKQMYARQGAKGLVDFYLYPPWQAPERNAVWQADHFELPVDVIADRCTTTVVKPWLTAFIDDRTRKLMAWNLTAEAGRRPDADVVCATLAAGMQIRLEEGVEVGGVPRIARWDNGAEFTAGVVLQFGTTVGFECHAVPPDSGHMKGKIERFGRRVQEQFCVLQPGYTHGPKTYSRRDLFRATDLLTAQEFRARLDLWIAGYDRTIHEGIDQTPLEAWAADTTPLRRATPTQLRPALLVAPRKYTVEKRKGVHFKGEYWQSAALVDIVGRKVEVRYPVGHQIDFIEIYQDGKWRCTAWRAESLTADQRKDLFDHRRELYTEVQALHNQATQLRIGANAQAGDTDATPAVASMPAVDPLAADADDLYELLARSPAQEAAEDATKKSADDLDGSGRA